MSIYEKINRVNSGTTYEEKLYTTLLNARYSKNSYRIQDLGEDMALVQQLIWGWWKPRFLMDHRTRCAYEFMNSDFVLVTLTENDIDWASIPQWAPDNALTRAKEFLANFPTLVYHFQDNRAKVQWQINPDGRYYMDEDGYGMTDDDEISLWGEIDRTGKVVKQFRFNK